MIDIERAFKFLDVLGTKRTSGTELEKRAADYLADELRKVTSDVEIEEFEVPRAKHILGLIEVPGTNVKINVNPMGFGTDTGASGIKKGFIHIDSVNEVSLRDVKDKVVLLNSCNLKDYKKLVEAGAYGFIRITGGLYDHKVLEWDIDFRDKQVELGKLLGVVIKHKAADLLATLNPSEIKITSHFEDEYTKSRNVIATIKGESDEVVCFSAHYDSVPTSPGVYNNLSGVVGILEMFYYYSVNKPKRTMKFLFAGSEELGLLGSRDYCKRHDLSKYRLNINLDMIGVRIGFDHARITASKELKSYLDYFAKIEGFNLNSMVGIYSSDSTSFAEQGVPSMSFARLPIRGGKQIHNNLDNIDFLGKPNMKRTIEFIIKFASSLDKAFVFPEERKIEPELVKKIDEYFAKTKKEENK